VTVGNWVIVCHGTIDPDRDRIQVPDGTELRFWVNEGQPANVGAAEQIVEELRRNPVELDSLQHLIDRTWPQGVRWDATHGTGGQWVQALLLHGDATIDCVGVLDLTTRRFQRWRTTTVTTLQQLLQARHGTIHLICCRD
jgi:hypothetical protein